VLGSDVARDLPITEQFNGRVIDLRSDLVRSKASDMVETQIS